MTSIIPEFAFPPLNEVREKMNPVFECGDAEIPHSNLAPRDEHMPEGATPYPPSEPFLKHRGRAINRNGENEWTISSPSPNWRWKFMNVPANPTLEWVVQGEVLLPRPGVNIDDFPDLSQDDLFAMATLPVTQHPDLGMNSEDLVDLNGAWWERNSENFYSFAIHSPLVTGEPEGGLGFWGGLNVAINWITELEDAYGVPQLKPSMGIMRGSVPDASASGPQGVAGELELKPLRDPQFNPKRDEPSEPMDDLDGILSTVARTRRNAKANIKMAEDRFEAAKQLRADADAAEREAIQAEEEAEAARVALRDEAQVLMNLLKADEDFPEIT